MYVPLVTKGLEPEYGGSTVNPDISKYLQDHTPMMKASHSREKALQPLYILKSYPCDSQLNINLQLPFCHSKWKNPNGFPPEF